eukprot:383177-Heterocapsa_arctica.AAC.1
MASQLPAGGYTRGGYPRTALAAPVGASSGSLGWTLGCARPPPPGESGPKIAWTISASTSRSAMPCKTGSAMIDRIVEVLLVRGMLTISAANCSLSEPSPRSRAMPGSLDVNA